MQQRLMSPELIHVAASGEARGRVVLAVAHGMPADAAIDAALTIAQAFDASLETLLIECPDAVVLAAHGFAREVSYAGRMSPLLAGPVQAVQRGQKSGVETVVSAKAARAHVEHSYSTVQTSYSDAIRDTCDAFGPWNIVVRAEVVGSRCGRSLERCLQETPGATGVVVVAAEKLRSVGDVVVVVDDVERLTQMVKAAQKIAAAIGAGRSRPPSVRLLLGGSHGEHDDLEGLVRLAMPARRLDDGADVIVDPYRVTFGTHAELSEAIRKLDGCFVIGRTGGGVLPREGEPNQLVHGLRAPLLLVR